MRDPGDERWFTHTPAADRWAETSSSTLRCLPKKPALGMLQETSFPSANIFMRVPEGKINSVLGTAM